MAVDNGTAGSLLMSKPKLFSSFGERFCNFQLFHADQHDGGDHEISSLVSL